MFVAVFAVLCSPPASGQTGYVANVYVETIAGSGFTGLVNGQGTQTMFDTPNFLAVDFATNVYIWDSGNRVIRKIDHTFSVSSLPTVIPTEAGSYVRGMTTDGTNLFLAGRGLNFQDFQVWSVAPNGALAVLGSTNLSQPTGICRDSKGIIFVSSEGQRRIYRLTNGAFSVFAGSGDNGSIDGTGIFSSFWMPRHLAVDSADNIWVSDGGLLRRITQAGAVTTVHSWNYGGPLAVDSSGTFFGLGDMTQVGRLSQGTPSVLAGASAFGFKDGEGWQAQFKLVNQGGIAIGPDARIYIADTGNQRIRRITYGMVPTGILGIGFYAGLSIAGQVGRSYRVEFSTMISNPPSWTNAATVRISESPFLWIDPDSSKNSQRFYRTVLLP